MIKCLQSVSDYNSVLSMLLTPPKMKTAPLERKMGVY